MTPKIEGKQIPKNYRNIRTTITEEVYDTDTSELLSKRIINQFDGIKAGRD